MSPEQATKIILRPHITEKTFNMIDDSSRICFVVDRYASKPQIVEAIKTLYNEQAVKVNTARTIYGKKAFVQFSGPDKAKDLATKIGML